MLRWCAGWRCPTCQHVTEVRAERWTVPHYAVAIGLVIGLAAACSGLAGCGPSAVAIQARTADTIGRTVNASTGPLTEAYEAAQRAEVERVCPERAAPCDRATVQAAVEAVRARWGVVRAAHDSLRLIHDTWAGQIEACARSTARDACSPQVFEMAGRVIEVANTWRCALRAVGVQDPIPLPLSCAPAPGAGAAPEAARDGGAE